MIPDAPGLTALPALTDRAALLRPEQVADIRQRTVSYLAKERTARRGPRYIRDGRMIRYRLGDVLDWLKMQEVGTTDQPRADLSESGET
ncbi:hypothetical protein QNO21_07605 [Microbacterium sp. zg-Y818]|uniref:hypothetical protein n=1 Tax=unclassified Microbacterium TaxID=2609290 RepID=UPI00214BD1BD|nr:MULTISPECIES: hypothetical protein [unclassified Microbacterium]MCR2801170.1 hypothetical protein [Microbacterium sp. zg.Y818]WIM21006.1 hypothetical protein QNO21_07605 [Microbacterium sp. zg-Y818]